MSNFAMSVTFGIIAIVGSAFWGWAWGAKVIIPEGKSPLYHPHAEWTWLLVLLGILAWLSSGALSVWAESMDGSRAYLEGRAWFSPDTIWAVPFLFSIIALLLSYLVTDFVKGARSGR